MFKFKGYKKLYAAMAIFFFLLFSAPAIAATLTLSSGQEIDLTARQVELLKEQEGIYFFQYPPRRIISGKLKYWVFMELPEEFGGGFVIGKQERIEAALITVGVGDGTGKKDTYGENGSSATIMSKEGVTFEEEIAIGPRLYLTLGGEKWEGDTTYQIGGTVTTPSTTYGIHFPLSELEFPLDVYMFSLSGSLEITKKLFLSVGAKKNITDDAGKMKDSDWGIPFEDPPGSDIWWWYGPDSLDIYSESDAELDALMLDINLQYKFFKKSGWAFTAGLGYLYQNFDYECSLIRQWSPSGLSGYDYTGTGELGLTYEVKYSIPYAEIGAQFKIKDFSVETTLGYSPFVTAKDEDHHILRSKVNKGDCDGDAIFYSLKGQYGFLKNWFLTLGFEYTKIETEGKSDAYFYGVYDHTIDEEIFSEQKIIAFTVRYVF